MSSTYRRGFSDFQAFDTFTGAEVTNGTAGPASTGYTETVTITGSSTGTTIEVCPSVFGTVAAPDSRIGWECPRCHVCMSPDSDYCTQCAPAQVVPYVTGPVYPTTSPFTPTDYQVRIGDPWPYSPAWWTTTC